MNYFSRICGVTIHLFSLTLQAARRYAFLSQMIYFAMCFRNALASFLFFASILSSISYASAFFVNVSPSEKNAMAPSSPPAMIHEAFHAQAIRTPLAPCLIDAVTGKVWSYRETQHRVLALASELRLSGTSADKVVAIFMGPCPRYVVSMLAALSAGGAVSSSIESFLCQSHHF